MRPGHRLRKGTAAVLLIGMDVLYALAWWLVVGAVVRRFPALDTAAYSVGVAAYAAYLVLHVRDVLDADARRRLRHRIRDRAARQFDELRRRQASDRADDVLRDIAGEAERLERGLRVHDGPTVRLELGQAERMARSLHGRYCGHPVVDALLRCKADLCAQRGVDCRFDCRVPDGVGLSGVELCSVFGNVLDNAIHACVRLDGKDDRRIDLRARVGCGCLQVVCRNAYAPGSDEAIARDDGTASPDRDHGWGLPILRQIAASHRGLLSYGPTSGTVDDAGGSGRTAVWQTRIVIPLDDDAEERRTPRGGRLVAGDATPRRRAPGRSRSTGPRRRRA